MTTVKLAGISKRYHGNRLFALRDINCEFPAGSLTAIVGPSGCGKTTLLKIISGIESGDTGTIHHDEASIDSLLPQHRQTVMLLQQHLLFPYLNVYENIAFGLRVRKMAEKAIRERVLDMLTLIGLPGFAKRYPHQLSGGEQKRVALARAIIIRPKVLLLDEPLTNLDRYLWREISKLVITCHKRYGLTTILVTHNQEEALMMADRFVFLFDGTIEQIGSGDDLYRAPRSVEVARFFDTQNIFHANKRKNKISIDACTITVPDHIHRTCPDGKIYLCVRPEDISIASTGAAPASTLSGTVQRSYFNGSYWANTVGVGTGEWMFLSDAQLATDSKVDITLNPERISLFPRPDSPN